LNGRHAYIDAPGGQKGSEIQRKEIRTGGNGENGGKASYHYLRLLRFLLFKIALDLVDGMKLRARRYRRARLPACAFAIDPVV
jgi:hypothetical protein